MLLPSTSFVVVYDASVLYPARIRDLLIRIAAAGLVRARWTRETQDEWLQNLLRNAPHLTEQRLRRTQRLMNEAVRDCLVVGYEDLTPALSLPDPNDRHVLAAAIRAGAQVIVTENIRHFPHRALADWGIEAERADPFLHGLLDQEPGLLAAIARQQWEALTRPRLTRDQFLDGLEHAGLVQTAAALRTLL